MRTPPTRGNRPSRPPRATTRSPRRATAPPTAPPPSSAPAAPAADRVVLAAITGAHGVGGEVKLKLFSDNLGSFKQLNDGALTLVSLRGAGVARLAEITTREAAEALRGTLLTVARTELPPLGEGEYYHADLIGLTVTNPDGLAVGQVVAVENFGAGDVIEIEKPDGKRFMAPMKPEAVPEWSADRLILDDAFIG
jgi:16S rRNA processing protein RimM